MDSHRFDRLAKLFGASASRRGVVAGLLAGAIPPLMNPSDDVAGRDRSTRQGKPKRQKGKKNRRSNRGQNKKQAPRPTRTEAARCCSRGSCTPGQGKNLGACCYQNQTLARKNFKGANLGSANFTGANLTNANFAGTNLGKACLVNTDLTGATINGSTNLGGTIFCRTTMPDGSANNSGCTKATHCCETCNVDPGEDCSTAGDVCCQGAICQDGTCSCPASTPVLCDGRCIDPETDRNNCGACRNACAQREACQNGTCSCPASKPDLCAGGCVDLDTDRNNCGECGDACVQGEACQGGVCGEVCGDGFCPANGEKPTCCGETCTDTETDPANCGSCGETCASGRDCCAGDCIDTNTDQNNCGACGFACGPRRLCESGGCNQCDVCPIGCAFTSVQAAVNAASDGDVIRICAGTWVGDVTISTLVSHAEKLVLIGAGDGANPAVNTILRGSGSGSVVSINGRIVTLQDVRITGGSTGDGGGIALLKADLTMTGCTVTGNAADRDGGGIHNAGPNGSVALNNSRVTGNTAGNRGGGIFNDRVPDELPSTVTISNSVVTGNTANGGPGSGGGIYNEGKVVFNSGTLSPNAPDNCLDIPPQGQGCSV